MVRPAFVALVGHPHLDAVQRHGWREASPGVTVTFAIQLGAVALVDRASRHRTGRLHRLPRPFAQIGDQAFLAQRPARDADVAAVQDQPVMGVQLVFARARPRSSFSSTSSGVLPGARPVRLPTRKMCVSTAMVGSPKAMLSTTLAVLRPTPGSASSASRVARHLAAVLGDQHLRQRDHVLRLGAEQADGLDELAHPLLAERHHLLRRVGDARTAPASPC